MITGIQILGLLFGLFMLYVSFLYYKRKELKAMEWGFWSLLWLVFIGLALLPGSLDFVVKDVLEMQRPLDFLIILGFMFLIGVTFYNYHLTKKTQAKVEDIVRKIAIRGKKP
jgi:hypothetical protein